MAKYNLDELRKMPSPGVFWGGGYKNEYAKYETALPYGFPYINDTEEEGPRYVMGEDGFWYNPAAAESGRAMLCCTGDLMCEPRQHAAYKYGNSYYFHPQFKFVRNILKGADFSVGNLETTLTDLTAYAGNWHRIDGKYHCNAPKSYLDALRYAGFDALVNANNHNCDSAVAGLMDTLDALDEYRFMHTGTFHPDGDPRFLLVKINGIKVAVLSYATYFNKLETNFTQLGRDLLLNAFDAEKAAADVAAARACGAEFVMSYIHWGVEYTHESSETQRKYAQQLADAGVDYIVGSHSHCLQPRSTVQTKDGRTVPVIYSMGNFVTNEAKTICRYTGILQLILDKDSSGIHVSETFIPCYIFSEIRSSAFAPVPTDITLNGGVVSDTLTKAEAYIAKVMDQLPLPLTTQTDIDEICSILSIKRPESIKNRKISRLCSNPDNVTPGSAFFGIVWTSKTELTSVYKKGAAAVITNRQIEGVPCLVVEDVNKAYCDVYAALHRRFNHKTALVTGSVGKTTTKEIMEQVMSCKYVTHASPGNWNTRHTGMLIMQRLREYHEFYLQEVHEGDRNSAGMMSKALQPDYCVITNIDSPHRENFSSDEEFLSCFTDVTAGLKDDGILFVNGDDKMLMQGVKLLGDKPWRVVTFGVEREDLDYRAENIAIVDGHLELDVVYGDERLHVWLDSPVEKNAYNVAAAVALGVANGVNPADMPEAIAKYESDGIRQHVMEYRGLKMMLDCRSAAPTSMASAIHAFCALEPAMFGKRVAVIGDMHLDGDESKTEHRKVGKLIAESNIDYLLCYGPESKHVCDQAIKSGMPKSSVLHCETKRVLEQVLYNLLNPGDTLLIKGGRRMYLNSTIRKLFGYTISID